MIVKIYEQDENEYGEGGALIIKTPKHEVSIGHMEPEDATLNRDLSCVYNIPDMIREAYEAGKQGDVLEFVYLTDEDDI